MRVVAGTSANKITAKHAATKTNDVPREMVLERNTSREDTAAICKLVALMFSKMEDFNTRPSTINA